MVSSRKTGGLEEDTLLLPGVPAGMLSSLGSPNPRVQRRSRAPQWWRRGLERVRDGKGIALRAYPINRWILEV